MTLPADPTALVTHVLSSGRLRAIIAEITPEQHIAIYERLWELDRVAVKGGFYLAAQSADRAAVLFASPTVTAAHDELAEALEDLGYVTIKEEYYVE